MSIPALIRVLFLMGCKSVVWASGVVTSSETVQCSAWGGQEGLNSTAVAELVGNTPPGTQLCLEVGVDVVIQQPLRVPTGASLELRARPGVIAPVVSAAGLLERRAITVERGATLMLRGLVLANAPYGFVSSNGGSVHVASCSFERNGAAAAGLAHDRPATKWSTAYAGSMLGLTVATKLTDRSGRSGFVAPAAASAAGMLLLPASVVAPCSGDCGSTGDTQCCYNGKNYDRTNGTKADMQNGGAIEMDDGDLQVISSRFEENYAHKGGAIYWSTSDSTTNTFKLLDSSFHHNQARDDQNDNRNGWAGNGGAVYVKGSTTTTANPVLLRRVSFTRNVAYSLNVGAYRYERVYGGALSIVNTNLLAQDCAFSHNGVAARSPGDDYAYGGAVAIQATEDGFSVTLDSCSFEGNDAMHGHAIYSTGDCNDQDCPEEESDGVTLAVVNCSFATNGQGGVMDAYYFEEYRGQYTIHVYKLPVQYVASRGLAEGDIHIVSAGFGEGAETESCSEASLEQKVCPTLYFGPVDDEGRLDYEWKYEVAEVDADGIENYYDLFDVSTEPDDPTQLFSADPSARQCADCSADSPSDCGGLKLGVQCTTWVWQSEGGPKVAECASNGYGTGCTFCGYQSLLADEDAPTADHTCGITSTGTAAGNCTDDGAGFSCQCNPGWHFNQTSEKCDIDVDECWSGPCQNGGTCVDSSEDVRVAPDAYRCDCVAGWGGVTEPAFTGIDCEIDVDECASRPCKYEGFCVESGLLIHGAAEPQQYGVKRPVLLQFKQPACSVQSNYPPASWAPISRVATEAEADPEATEGEEGGEETPSAGLTEEEHAEDILANCDDDIRVFYRQFSGEDYDELPDELAEKLKTIFRSPNDEMLTQMEYPDKLKLHLAAMWCMIKKGDMSLWPWWCNAHEGYDTRGCAGVTFTTQLVGADNRRMAAPPIVENRSLFTPFLLEQLGWQAYDLDSESVDGTKYQQVLGSSEDGQTSLQPTHKLTQMLERLECRALGGCCPDFNTSAGSATSYPQVDPDSGLAGVRGRGQAPGGGPRVYAWDPADSRSTTDCQKAYRDHCEWARGVAPELVDGTGLYVGCETTSCRRVSSGGCTHSSGRQDEWHVTVDDYVEMMQAEEKWSLGHLVQNCISSFDFETHDGVPGREFYDEDKEVCRYCTSLVPVGTFGCQCAPGYGWDNSPYHPRDVYMTASGVEIDPARPPLSQRGQVDTCDYLQDNCQQPELGNKSPCKNGAVCVNQPADYRCECTSGWTGKQCDICEGIFEVRCQNRWMTLLACVCLILLCGLLAHRSKG